MALLATGNGPYSVALSPDNSTLYVINLSDGTVGVVDTASFTLTTAVGLGTGAVGPCALTPDGTSLLIPTYSGLYVFDTATNTMSGAVTGIFGGVSTVVVSPDGTTAYAGAGYAGGAIWVIDIASFTATSDITIGTGAPGCMAITPDGATLYTVQSSGDIYVIDIGSATITNTFTGEFDGGFGPGPSCAISQDGTKAYFLNYASSTSAIRVLDIGASSWSGLSFSSAPYFYYFVGFSPDGTVGIAVDYVNAHTYLFDPSTGSLTHDLATNGGGDDAPPWAVMSSDNATLYVPLHDQNEVLSLALSLLDLGSGETDWSIDWAPADMTVLAALNLTTGETDWSVDWADAELTLLALEPLTGETDWSIDWLPAELTVHPIVALTGEMDLSIDWADATITSPLTVSLTGTLTMDFHWGSASLAGMRPKVTVAPQNPTPPALLDGMSHTRISRVEVWNGKTFIQAIPVISGSVTVDQTATVRRTHSVTVPDHGISPDNPNSLVPDKETDLLHPLSQNELHIFRGFRYDDGTEVLYPWGVFPMTKPVVTDQGTDIQITINGNDRSSWIALNKWTEPYVISPGADLATAVIALLNDRWTGPAPLDFSRIEATNPIGHGKYGSGLFIKLPATTFGADPSSSNNPWSDIQTLCMNAAGMDLYFDPEGRPVLESVLQPSMAGVAPVMKKLYEEDSGKNTATKATNTFDETGTYSGVVAIGNGSGTDPNGLAVPPVTSRSISPTNGQTYIGVWNTNPDMATYYDPGNERASRIGRRPYIFTTQSIPGFDDTEATAQVKINAVAKATLQYVTTAYLNPTFDCVPNPALQENDVVTFIRKRAGIDGNYIVQAMTMPLDVSTVMSVTLKPQQQVAV